MTKIGFIEARDYVVKDAAEFFALDRLEVGRYVSKDGLAWDVSDDGPGDWTQGGMYVNLIPVESFVLMEAYPLRDDTDATPIIQKLAAKYGMVRGQAGKTYRLLTSTTQVVDKDIHLDFSDCVLVSSSGNISFSVTERSSGSFVSIQRNATSVSYNATAHPGDLLRFGSNVVIDTTNNYAKRMVRRVVGISNNILQLDQEVFCHVNSSEEGAFMTAHPPLSFKFSGNLVCTSETADALVVRYFTDVNTDGVVMNGSDNYDTVAYPIWPRGIQVSACDSWSCASPTIHNMGYALRPMNGTRGTSIFGGRATRTRHPVDPASWADGVVVDGMRSTLCHQTIGCHGSLNISYSNIIATDENDEPHMRCIGGSIKNCRVTIREGASMSLGAAYMGNVTPTTGHEYLMDASYIEVDGLHQTKLGNPVGKMLAHRGDVHFDNITSDSVVVHNTARKVSFGSNINAKMERGVGHIRKTVRRSLQPIVDAVQQEGSPTYTIDLNRNYLDQTGRRLKAFGTLASGIQPGVISVVVKDNAFGAADTANYVSCILALDIHVRHSSSGAFDVARRVYSFHHKIVSTSSIVAPVAPVHEWNSGTSGSKIATILSNVTQEGVTQGGALKDYGFSFDLSTNITATSPLITINYDIDLTML